MARPRIHIRIKRRPDGSLERLPKNSKDGEEVYGLSYNESNGEYYSIPQSGQQRYWGRVLETAIREYRASLLPDNLSVDFGVALFADLDASPDKMITPGVNRHDPKTHLGRWSENLKRALDGQPPLPPLTPDEVNIQPLPPAAPQTLKDCVKAWESIKHDDGCQQLYIDKVTLVATRLIKLVGNKSVSRLTADDFAEWRRHITIKSKKHSPLWHNDNHKRLKTLFMDVRRERPSWELPTELPIWLDQWKPKKHLADKHNRARMPLDVFTRLLTTAQEWSKTDVDSLPTKTQQDKAKRLQAERKQIEGVRWIAILKLTVNCALDNVDCRRITWDAIKTDGRIPYMDFARPKAARQVGSAVERKTPLLPSTIAALDDLHKVQPYKGNIFRTAQGGAYSHNGFSNAFAELCEQSSVTGWTFKHIRNIAPSVGRDGKRSTDEREAILGHVVDGVSKFYTDDADESYLLDLVNLVGQTYFGGEQVALKSV